MHIFWMNQEGGFRKILYSKSAGSNPVYRVVAKTIEKKSSHRVTPSFLTLDTWKVQYNFLCIGNKLVHRSVASLSLICHSIECCNHCWKL